MTNHALGGPSLRAQIADAGIAVRLTELLRRRLRRRLRRAWPKRARCKALAKAGRLHDQRMMEKRRRFGATEQPRELNLTPGRREQIVTADHVRDALNEIVNRRDELIGPVA